MAKSEINKTHIQKLKQQKRSVGLLRFKYSDDQNFSKWYSLTENLVIRSFGPKSNQISQLHDLHGDMLSSGDTEYYFDKRLEVRDAKEKLKDLIAVFVSELELDFEEELKVRSRKSGNISMRMENSQTLNQTLNISTTIENIINNIKQTESNPEKVAESEQKLRELVVEIKSKNPAWSKVKDILIWLLNFGRDTFLQVLPVILERYK